MIISDDVYGTFVDEFRSLVADLAFNTIGVYSFQVFWSNRMETWNYCTL